MSNFKLGIFDNLAGYLTAAITECPGGVENCKAGDKTCNKYFLQKYYPSKHLTNPRNEDVVSQFTNSVAKLGNKLKSYDVSVGSAPSLLKLLQDTASRVIDKITVTSTSASLTDLATGLNTDLLDGAAADGTTGLKDLKLKPTLEKSLLDEFKTEINTASLSPSEQLNANNCLVGATGGIKPGTTTPCTKLDLSAAISSRSLTMGATS